MTFMRANACCAFSLQPSIGGVGVEGFLSRAACEAAFAQAPGKGSLANFHQQPPPMFGGILLGQVGVRMRQPVAVMARELALPPLVA
jgi:hypothetical protein